MTNIKTPIEICIPRVENTVTRNQIFDTFKKMKIGYITKIIENPLRNQPTGRRIVIKVDWNTKSQFAQNLHDNLKNNKPVNLVYKFPLYWKLVANSYQI